MVKIYWSKFTFYMSKIVKIFVVFLTKFVIFLINWDEFWPICIYRQNVLLASCFLTKNWKNLTKNTKILRMVKIYWTKFTFYRSIFSVIIIKYTSSLWICSSKFKSRFECSSLFLASKVKLTTSILENHR